MCLPMAVGRNRSRTMPGDEGGGVGGSGCAAAAPCEEAGVSGGQREAVRLDHATELRRALRGNGNLISH